MYPKCSKCNTFPGHFYLIMNFKVTIRKYMPYNFRGESCQNMKNWKWCWGLQGPWWVQGLLGQRPPEASAFKLFWKTHDQFLNSSNACCTLQITVWKIKPIILCDKYIPYRLFVTKDKPTHKENHGRRLWYFLYMYISKKGHNFGSHVGPQNIIHMYDEHLLFI